MCRIPITKTTNGFIIYAKIASWNCFTIGGRIYKYQFHELWYDKYHREAKPQFQHKNLHNIIYIPALRCVEWNNEFDTFVDL